MVDMVNDQIGWGVHYFTMHFNSFSVISSARIRCFCTVFDEPSILGQPVIIGSINDDELIAGKWYPPGGLISESAICRRVEILAGTIQMKAPPFILKVFFLLAH